MIPLLCLKGYSAYCQREVSDITKEVNIKLRDNKVYNMDYNVKFSALLIPKIGVFMCILSSLSLQKIEEM
ncbi:MAG: hypothetical protein COS27_09880 [Nitrospirae bacterium CG02_land_8_20_14_3_00_41_53]|nr:MAG: hypothetical protein COS27_09880 [Nitrospirae bacterium CG02_land_8_20_14_3_00_41_53]PIW87549.1 MAG: hypothetical protein COZ94_04545 [Nitrospirae bacterium CG_4_8_14_3_um_filter_41_47]